MTTTSKRTRRSRAQWQSLISRAEQSPLSTAEFCRAESISTASFYGWRQRLGVALEPSAQVAEDAAPFLDLGLLGDGGVGGEAGRWEIELALGAGLTLRLRRG